MPGTYPQPSTVTCHLQGILRMKHLSHRIRLAFWILLKRHRFSLWRSIWFNLRYLPFRQAIHLPILLAPNVYVRICKRGSFVFLSGAKFGIVQIGYIDNNGNPDQASSLNIQGMVIIHGTGMHAFGGGLRLKVHPGAVFEIGNKSAVSNEARINVAEHVIIGDNNMWSYEVNIMDTDSHKIYDSTRCRINPPQPVHIGNNVWIGSKCTILKGVTLADGIIVAANSTITKSFTEPHCIITTGNKVIKRDVSWER